MKGIISNDESNDHTSRRILGKGLLHLRNYFVTSAKRDQCHFLILGSSSWNVAQDLLRKRNKKFLFMDVRR